MEFNVIRPRREGYKGLNKKSRDGRLRKIIIYYSYNKSGYIKRNYRNSNALNRFQKIK